MRHSINTLKAKTLLIAAIGFTTTTALGQANVWLEGVSQGASTILQLWEHFTANSGDYEDSVTTVFVEHYLYQANTTYYYPGAVYNHTWYVFRDWNNTYQYSYYGNLNGTSVSSTRPFEIGSSGQPFTKRQWACSRRTPTLSFDATSTGSLTFSVKHTVTRACANLANSPMLNAVSVFFGGQRLAAVCGDAEGKWDGSTYSLTVPRNGTTKLTYNDANLLIDSIYGKVVR